MRFSIRAILALTFLVALAMLAWRSRMELQKAEATREVLEAEIDTMEASLRTDEPELHRLILTAEDEAASFQKLRAKVEQAFPLLREKYSEITPPEEDNTFAMRGLPTLPLDEPRGHAPVEFRFLVPEGRPVWLKFGVHQADSSSSHVSNPDEKVTAFTESPFQDTGPFEMQLPPGDRILSIQVGFAENDELPLRVAYGDQVLLDTKAVTKDISSSSFSNISATKQFNVPPQQKLPWLMGAKVDLPPSGSGAAGSNPSSELGFTFWLSDEPSGFDAFPGK